MMLGIRNTWSITSNVNVVQDDNLQLHLIVLRHRFIGERCVRTQRMNADRQAYD